MKRYTIEDVAKKAGVSIATVSRVINGSPVVKEQTVERVQKAMEDLQYIPDTAAQNLALRKTDTLGLVLPQIGGEYFPLVLRGIEMGASEAGYHLLIYTTSSRLKERDRRQYLPVGPQNTDGLIIFANALDEDEIRHLSERGFRLIVMFQTAGNRIPSITIENREGVRLLTEHLIRVHGRKRILHLRGPENSEDAMLRSEGYVKALQENGIPFHPEYIRRAGFDREGGKRAILEVIEAGIEFDAVVTADDECAAGAMLALRMLGKEIPQDVAVVGFDDIRLASYLTPPLTTVTVPLEDVGKAAINMLIHWIRTDEVPESVQLGTKVTIRESCGCNA